MPERRPVLPAGCPPPLELIVHHPLSGPHARSPGYFDGSVHEVQSEIHLGSGLQHGLRGGEEEESLSLLLPLLLLLL